MVLRTALAYTCLHKNITGTDRRERHLAYDARRLCFSFRVSKVQAIIFAFQKLRDSIIGFI